MKCKEEQLEYPKRKIWRLAYARRAFYEAKEACEKWMELKDESLYRIFISFACVTYCKPFTDCFGIGQLSPNYSKLPNMQLQKSHNNMMAARMRFLAHTDATMPYHRLFLKAKCVGGEIEYMQRIQVPMILGVKFIPELCSCQMERVDAETNNIAHLIHDAYGLDELAMKANGEEAVLEVTLNTK